MRDELSKYRGPEGLALARGTIDVLGEAQIPTNPANFEIWTAHRLGLCPDLSREIETILAKGDSFTDKMNEDLFERFFANTRLSVQVVEASEGITRELAEAVLALRAAGEQSGSYANQLQSAASTFEGGLDANDFRNLVADLTSAARAMADQHLLMSKQMEASTRHVESLQATLQTVKIEALTDGLTGLANRKYFDETLRRRLQESQGAKSDLCLLMCDIDHFKRFNDTFGHPIGDQVIKFIAQTLKQHAPGDFLAARYGGEEFALIMPRTCLPEAKTIASAIHLAVRSKTLRRRSNGDGLGAVTISVGLTVATVSDTPNSLIARADAYLYASKRAGRDRVTTHGEADQASAA